MIDSSRFDRRMRLNLAMMSKAYELSDRVDSMLKPYMEGKQLLFNKNVLVVPDAVVEKAVSAFISIMRLRTRDPKWLFGDGMVLSWHGLVVYPQSVWDLVQGRPPS